MAKKTGKSKKTTKYDPKAALFHPSTWLVVLLTAALIAVCSVSAYGFTHIKPKTELDFAKLSVFDHLIESYTREMEFTTDYDKPAITQATGYGVSDENGVFYVTVDFAPYPSEGETLSAVDDLDFRHGIIYFQWDAERDTYGHAYSYHDDASYHPDGIYVKIEP